MEIEDFNALMELAALNQECYDRAVNELAEAGKEISPQAITELFEKYEQEYAIMKKLKKLGFEPVSEENKQM